MKYGIIGAGAMGVRYGAMMQENAGIDVDYIETWEPNIERVKEQGGVSTATLSPSTFTGQKSITVIRMSGLSSRSKCNWRKSWNVIARPVSSIRTSTFSQR